MDYQTFQPHSDLASLVKCYWRLEVPVEAQKEKQRILPDGCIELIFILGDDIKRYTSEHEFIIQPRAVVVGQITEPFIIQPTGYVHCFAARFYPLGFANFVTTPLKNLANKETPIGMLFGEEAAKELAQKMIGAANTDEQIKIIETFLLQKYEHKVTIDHIVKSTVEALLATKGNTSIANLLKEDPTKRRQLERKFVELIGLSPKQLGKVIRLQSALKLLLNQQPEKLTRIAYESDYYDQAHFNRDFKEFTGINPKEFLESDKMLLSAIFYTED
ncbi:AraC family transcriptional regulator [Pedobacter psychroterrae]|uniref:AraC family transcriptional regulator n=1 Tax=Pedobacter psychroterrae TaxID=2530453 RepID=A0A4R0NN41_9SPHI|nr:helix-turn-helix domain-containing protein [Pedobacter psychroterrae]TCD01358.1 AraC family transcriptional regulator [Pedobacter psychroterrae]